ENPWKNVIQPIYPSGFRLFLNDDRFWVSMNNEGQILFFVHGHCSKELSLPDRLAGVDLEYVKYSNSSRRLVCTLTSNDIETQSKFSIVTKDIVYKCSGLEDDDAFIQVAKLIESWSSFLM